MVAFISSILHLIITILKVKKYVENDSIIKVYTKITKLSFEGSKACICKVWWTSQCNVAFDDHHTVI